MKQIIINSEELQTRVAVVCDGVLHDFFMERNERDRLVGSIYKAKIKNLEPSLQAAFVDIGCGKNAFLHYWDMLPASQDMLEGDGEIEEDDYPESAPQPPRAEAPVKKPSGNGFLARLYRLFMGDEKSEQTVTEVKEQKQVKPAQKQQQRRKQKQPKQPKPTYTVEDIPNIFKEGQEILVQVTKGPIGTKGARVTSNLSIPGRYLVLLPNSTHIGVSKRVEDKPERDRLRRMMRELRIPSNMGAICRTVGAGMKPEQFQRDLDILLDAWKKGNAQSKHAPACIYQEPDLAERTLRDCLTEDVDEIITDSQDVYNRAMDLMRSYNMQGLVKIRLYDSPTPIFNKNNLSQQIEGIFNRKVNLPSGGYICIDETEALIAIDVNTGKNRTGKDQPETILATNMEAVTEIARQLRLRNVGGLVVLDLIDMRSKKDQLAVYKKLKELMGEDRAKTKVYPISPLGLLEMTRQRENESIESTIFDDCPYCKGRGLVKSATSMSVEIQRRLNEICAKRKIRQLTVCVHPRILERLNNEDRKLITDIEVEHRAEITFKADSKLHVEDFQVFDSSNGHKL